MFKNIAEKKIMPEPNSAMRHLHIIRGATGEIRTAQYDGREHLVVPVVAMVEGVVWASNSEVPEFVPAEELAVSPQQWDGRGCFAGHPRDAGTQVTANTPTTLEKSFGLIFATSPSERIMKTRRLEMQAWLDPAKAEAVGPEAVSVIQRLRANERVEVSVGCYVEAEDRNGKHNGVEYHGIWHNIVSDHLAFLGENERGACSVAAGCGAPRTAIRHCITADGIRREERTMTEPRTLGGLLSKARTQLKAQASREEIAAYITLREAEGVSDADLRRSIDKALRAVEPGYLGIDSVYPDDGFVIYYVMPEEEWLMKKRGYKTDKDNKATLKDDAVKVEATTTTTYTAVREAAALISAPKIKTNCGCKGERTMEKTARAELIAALVVDKHSGFKDGDEPILEASSDARLEEFRSAADANRSAVNTITRLETDNRNTVARLKVIEEKLRAAEAPLTDDDFRRRAPEGIKAILDERKAEEDGMRASLVSQLKDLGGHSEEELKKKSTPDLRMLATYAHIDVPDYSGRGTPKKADEKNENFTPPDPYAAGLATLRTHSGKVN